MTKRGLSLTSVVVNWVLIFFLLAGTYVSYRYMTYPGVKKNVMYILPTPDGPLFQCWDYYHINFMGHETRRLLCKETDRLRPVF